VICRDFLPQRAQHNWVLAMVERNKKRAFSSREIMSTEQRMMVEVKQTNRKQNSKEVKSYMT
jgi:hypothetical protein